MLLKKFADDQLAARKARDSVASALLTTLVGEARMVGKNNGDRETSDDECIATVRKFIKNAEESLKHARSRAETDPDAVRILEREIAILNGYLPQQMTADEIKLAVFEFRKEKPGTAMGPIMAYLKETYGGRYDGKLASQIVKEALAAEVTD